MGDLIQLPIAQSAPARRVWWHTENKGKGWQSDGCFTVAPLNRAFLHQLLDEFVNNINTAGNDDQFIVKLCDTHQDDDDYSPPLELEYPELWFDDDTRLDWPERYGMVG